jgi:hypothetical protein
MEILNSMAGLHIEETRKQRMIREICLLLQFIDLNLQNNSSSVASSILDFAERTIKSRYIIFPMNFENGSSGYKRADRRVISGPGCNLYLFRLVNKIL